jgi:hypothetical protein
MRVVPGMLSSKRFGAPSSPGRQPTLFSAENRPMLRELCTPSDLTLTSRAKLLSGEQQERCDRNPLHRRGERM